MMLEPALSLLVDGRTVNEAVVIDSKGNMLCYPCLQTLVLKLNNIDLGLINKLVELNVLRICKSFLSLYLKKHSLAIIPLPSNKVLVLCINQEYEAERVASEYLGAIIKFLKLMPESSNNKTISSKYNYDVNNKLFNGVNSSIPFDKLNKLILGRIISAALVLTNLGEVLDRFGSIRLSKEVIKALVEFHNNIIKYLEYKIARIVNEKFNVILIPFGPQGEILVIAEVGKEVSTKIILRNIGIAYK